MEGLPDFDVIQTFLEVTNKGLDLQLLFTSFLLSYDGFTNFAFTNSSSGMNFSLSSGDSHFTITLHLQPQLV